MREDDLVQVLHRQLGVNHRRRAVDYLGGVAADDVHADASDLGGCVDDGGDDAVIDVVFDAAHMVHGDLRLTVGGVRGHELAVAVAHSVIS